MKNAMVLLSGVTDINYRKTKVVFAAKEVSGVKAIAGNNQVDDYRFSAVEKLSKVLQLQASLIIISSRNLK